MRRLLALLFSFNADRGELGWQRWVGYAVLVVLAVIGAYVAGAFVLDFLDAINSG